MSIHNEAKPGDIADFILLPGDPFRAKYIAEKYFTDFFCYNNVRGMLGYTGYYNGKRVSVQGTGMGMPSHSIYVEELINEYNVETFVRIGSCGALQQDVKLMDMILATGACTDSNMNRLKFKNGDFAPTPNFELLKKAWDTARNNNITITAGNILTADTFYNDASFEEQFSVWQKHNVLGVDMETAALYTIAARCRKKALSILTVSDHIVKKQALSSDDRLLSFNNMIKLALELL